jgi:putative transmembrane protein PGPGW
MPGASPNSFLDRLRTATKLDGLPSRIRRLIVGVVGGTVLLIGFALIFLPGPAIVVIPVGLAILATEFAWARRYVQKARELLEKAKRKK